MFVEKKKIGSNEYYYLRISKRKGNKVKTKTVAYLGKAPMEKSEINIKINQIPKSKMKNAQKELDESFENINLKFLDTKQERILQGIKKEFSQKIKCLDKMLVTDMFKDFKTYYTYNTNAIEGNTLTLEETNQLLNYNKTPEGKDLREIYDHINEKDTFDYILKNKPELNKKVIIDIHSKILKNIDKRVGGFRTHNVRILGTNVKTTEAKYVYTDMELIIKWYKKNQKLNPLITSAIFHEKFERVHPFYDGNGRCGRMIINLILMNKGYPPIIIKNSQRKEYFKVLNKGHKAKLTKTEPEHYKEIVQFCYQQIKNTYKEIFSKWG